MEGKLTGGLGEKATIIYKTKSVGKVFVATDYSLDGKMQNLKVNGYVHPLIHIGICMHNMNVYIAM